MLKYPRTRHLEGSRQQLGDEDLAVVQFSEIKNLPLVIEEKIDGANCGLSFDADGNLLLQSRGHYLTGGVREKHFNLFKQWGAAHQRAFWNVLGGRYIMYGEWVYVKHTIFYDALPHYFMEFDVFDREKEIYLDTPSRRHLLRELPIVSVPVLKMGLFERIESLTALIGPSNYITGEHAEKLRRYCVANGIYVEETTRQTDLSMLMEGLYIKHEEGGRVVGRYKYIRERFLQTVLTSDSHWLARPIVPNQLRVSIDDLFLPELPADLNNNNNNNNNNK